jgi:poly(beta-D-mannuronate) lyase
MTASRGLLAAVLCLAACTGEIAEVADTDGPDVSPEDAAFAADAAGAEATCTRTVRPSSSAQLAGAISSARAGDCIVLENGSYSFPTISKKGSEDNPIVISARNRGGAKVTSGSLALSGAAYVTVEGLTWNSSGTVKISNSDHCRISRFTFRPEETSDADWISVSGTSKFTRIDHNDLGPKRRIGNMIMLAGKGSQIVQNTRIDHNYFHDIARTSGNGWEAIRAGLSGLALSSSHTVIEFNLFEHADGDPETISLKSSDNVVRFNTLRATSGEFTLRHGNRNQIYGNFILGEHVGGSSGIRVCGEDHQIFNNYIQDIAGTGIFLESGDSNVRNEAGRAHYRVYNTKVVFNTIVGAKTGIANGGGHEFAPVNSVIANNIVVGASGSLYKERAPVTPTYAGNIGNPSGGTNLGMTVPVAAIRRVDPRLTSVNGVSRLSSGSPAIGAAVGDYAFVSKDIDGDARTDADVGADEFVAGSALAQPLRPQDVGPDAP